MKKNIHSWLLRGILLLGFFTRFFGLNWDQGYHLHPDERFLTMVGVAMKIPSTISEYFTSALSTLNPANIGFPFYVYGLLPVLVNKVLALPFQTDTYELFHLQGRFLSAVCDILVVLLIYKTVEVFEKRYHFNHYLKYLASFFYTIAVLPIQLAHFFTVDTFLNLFIFSSIYFLLRFHFEEKLQYVVLSAIFLGCAFASKISAMYALPLLGILFFLSCFKTDSHAFILPTTKHTWYVFLKKFSRYVLLFTYYVLIVYLVLRVTNPYLFESPNILNPMISKLFLKNIHELASFSNPAVWFPPSVQWLHKPPVLFSITNLVLYGTSIPFFIFMLIGLGYSLIRIKKLELTLVVLWVIGYFFYQSLQMVQTMRYYLILYPFFAIFAAIGFMYIHHGKKFRYYVVSIILLLIWPLAFFSIYMYPHSRVTASEWAYQNLPTNSVILSEHWDDALPLRPTNASEKVFHIIELPVFAADTSQKWEEMNQLLKTSDYLILSSNRGWGSIPTVPERYPKMTKFYEDLFADKLSYRKIKEFTSYPSLRYLGIPIQFPDDSAEEAFTVYDHPHVIIFQNMNKE